MGSHQLKQPVERPSGLNELSQGGVSGTGDRAAQSIGSRLHTHADHFDASALEDVHHDPAHGDGLSQTKRSVLSARMHFSQIGLVEDQNRMQSGSVEVLAGDRRVGDRCLKVAARQPRRQRDASANARIPHGMRHLQDTTLAIRTSARAQNEVVEAQHIEFDGADATVHQLGGVGAAHEVRPHANLKGPLPNRV